MGRVKVQFRTVILGSSGTICQELQNCQLFHKCTSENFRLGGNPDAENIEKGSIALFVVVKILKLFIMEIFNIKLG